MAVEILFSSVLTSSAFHLALMVVVAISVILLLAKAVSMYKRFQFFQKMPGECDYHLVYGNLHKVPKNPGERLPYILKQMKRYNRKFHRFWIGPLIPLISIYHPETIRAIVQSSAPKSRGLGSAYELALDWIGEGLISTNGARWARSRRLLTPAFHFDILKPYIKIYNEAADKLLEKLDKFAESGESFDMYPIITLCTLEVILKCSMSYDVDVQGSGHPYGTAVSQLGEVWVERGRRPWLWPNWSFKLSSLGKQFYKHTNYVHKIADDVIEARRKSLEKDGIPKNRRLDFIDLLLTARDTDNKPMTTLEIRNEVDTFMFAGHDTTASAIPWCLYTLTQHPEYQDRIQEEIDTVLNGRVSDDILMEDLSELKTLAICVKESMRLNSPVPFIQREMVQDLEIEGHVIPSGTIANISIYALHRNPDVWDNPDEYRPERFLTENKKDMDPHAFIPFSAGARNCIGQNFALNEEKVVLSRILRRYKVKLASDHPPPIPRAAATLRPMNGIWMTLERRK